MASLLRVLFFLAVVGASFAALFRGKAAVHKDFPGKCYVASLGTGFNPGSSWPVTGKCAKRTCYEEGGELYFEEASCGVEVLPANCRIVQEKSLPYPSCCPRLDCGKTKTKG
ncbi:U-scoloptoxin(16)-Sm1a [Penaeus vannamei]|uniref:U-scoloptoxin(16)-Sm1a n=1 Tax=Penaeus vannamei TaxID=6689 RepID=UPI00387F4591